MTACQCERIESRFDAAYAAEKLAAYRRSGPDRSTQALIDAILSEDVRGMTLLDIGGGVGAVQHALLRSGIASAQEVEASAAYIDACREEAERQGHGDRITHFMGDLGSVDDAVSAADIVTLDRSVCCWPDMPDLVGRSAAKARSLLGMVYPRDVWWVRYAWRAWSDVRDVLGRNPMRVFVHRTRDVESVLASHGLAPRSHASVGIWQVAVYGRESP